MRFMIYRKKTVNYTKSFEEVIQIGKAVQNREADYIGISFISEALPQNAFLRIDSKGFFKLYSIQSNGDIKDGVPCYLSMKLITATWMVTKNLAEVFSALDTTTGESFEITELLRKSVNYRNQRRKDFSNKKEEDNKVIINSSVDSTITTTSTPLTNYPLKNQVWSEN